MPSDTKTNNVPDGYKACTMGDGALNAWNYMLTVWRQNQAYDASGGATGSLGPADGGVYPVGGGFGQNYAGGKIFFTSETSAHIMGGAILQKYESLGGPADSDLGFPTIDEGPGKAADSRNTTFSAADNPVIFWTPDTGARVVRGGLNAAWDKLGGSAGPLGVRRAGTSVPEMGQPLALSRSAREPWDRRQRRMRRFVSHYPSSWPLSEATSVFVRASITVAG